MRSAVFSTLFAVVLLVLATSLEAKDSSAIRRHHAKVARAVTENVERDGLQKRAFSGTATWYSFGKGALGACGQGLDPNDYVVALNEGQYGSLNAQSSHCGKTITISNGVKTAKARIMDACPKGIQCHWGALDMSQSLFTFFNPLGVGVFDITWWFGDDGGDSSSSKSKSNSSNDDSDAKKEAAKKKAAKEKKEKEEKEAAEKKAEEKKAKEKKEKEEKEKEEKEKEEKEKKEKEKKKKEKEAKEKKEKEEKIENAQEQNIASFGAIMEALNSMVVDALDNK